jgi:transposase
MLRGTAWQEAAQQAGVVTSQSSAYRFVTAYCLLGEKTLEERRRGHAHKVVGDVLVWLLQECQEKPESTALELRAGLEDRFGVRVSKSHLNHVRRVHGVSRPQKKRGSARASGKTAPGAWSYWQQRKPAGWSGC